MSVVCWSKVSLLSSVSPRYLKLSTVSTVSLLMRVGGWGDGVPIGISLVLATLRQRKLCLHHWEKCGTVLW